MTETTTETHTRRARDQRHTLGKAIEALKDAVPIADYARQLTELHQNGQGLRGRCPVHGGDNPHSFAVYPDEGRFYCFSCQDHGDVIDLAQRVEDHAEPWTAVISLAQRYSVELPRRPERWHQRQDEKHRRREAIRRTLADSYQRRYFRAFFTEYLRGVESEVRESEAREIWRSLRSLALQSADQRLSA